MLEKIREINSAGSEKMIPRGRVRAKVVVVDGSDGFADLRIISSKESRELSNHGITCDFTVISVSMEHQVAEEGDFEVRHNKARATKGPFMAILSHFEALWRPPMAIPDPGNGPYPPPRMCPALIQP